MRVKIKEQRAKTPNVGILLDKSTKLFDASHSARLDAEVLLVHGLGKDRAWLYAHADDVLDPEMFRTCQTLIERRAVGEPVAYITGTREFWSLPLRVTPDVLIPRPETELLVELALPYIPAHGDCRIADLGTGCGCIALAIASMRPDAHILATDNSKDALAVARENARHLKRDNVEFRQGHWFEALTGQRFDLIVSNPPYIAANDPHLTQGDVRFEPVEALQSGPDGLDAIRLLIDNAKNHLTPGGRLLLEHGWNQRDAVLQLLKYAGYSNRAGHSDLNHHRAVIAKWN